MPTDPLDPDSIRENLRTKRIGNRILVYNSTSSTNDVAAEYAKNEENDGLAVFAEEQTAGRGRAGTKWCSNKGDSILCSIVLTKCDLNAELLSLACAVAVAEAVGGTVQTEAKIKWPNDIVLNGKKVAGILLESRPSRNGNTYIIGVGINCHQRPDSFPSELRSTATSIDMQGQIVCDRISVAKRLVSSVEHWLGVAGKNHAEVAEQWQRLSLQLGHRIRLSYNGKTYTGNCVGIDPLKGLIVQLETGGVTFFDAVHTTVLKAT
jgi:BirA family biotin operon repressor/biotin-[acetyl-CoA-carboxylase] ligase